MHCILPASVYFRFAFCCTKASITLLFWRKEIKAHKLFDLPLRAVVKGRAGPEPDHLPLPSSPLLATAKSLQSCPTLYDPIDGSPPGSPVPGILQARILEWVAISSSNA